MGTVPRLLYILVAVLLTAVASVPSNAWAHEGHAHHAAAAKATASPSNAVTPRAATELVTRVVTAVSAAVGHPNAGIAATTNCAGHCCGGAAGMACCGAALAADFWADPFVHASDLFVVPHIAPAAGLPPETLPRPPKSFV